MKIGKIELSDNCPECGTKLVKIPGPRIGNSYAPKWETFSVKCLRCEWESERVKLKINHNKKSTYDLSEMEDATPYKKYLWGLIKRQKTIY
jgi:hypothetical protein